MRQFSTSTKKSSSPGAAAVGRTRTFKSSGNPNSNRPEKALGRPNSTHQTPSIVENPCKRQPTDKPTTVHFGSSSDSNDKQLFPKSDIEKSIILSSSSSSSSSKKEDENNSLADFTTNPKSAAAEHNKYLIHKIKQGAFPWSIWNTPENEWMRDLNKWMKSKKMEHWTFSNPDDSAAAYSGASKKAYEIPEIDFNLVPLTATEVHLLDIEKLHAAEIRKEAEQVVQNLDAHVASDSTTTSDDE